MCKQTMVPSMARITFVTVLIGIYAAHFAGKGVLARKSVPGKSQFTEFGESCQDGDCSFNEGIVGADWARFCLTKAADGGKAVQLVKPDANHLGLELVKEGLQLLKSFPKPLAVVAAIGSVKTGKSFFMNVLNEHMLCGGSKSVQGFPFKNDVEPTTSGIWIWSKPITINCNGLKALLDCEENGQKLFDRFITTIDTAMGGSIRATFTSQNHIEIGECKNENVNLILMDVEGFNAIDGFQRYDEALFTIAYTLSTELIYLTHKVVDSRDVTGLQHMLQMANSHLIKMQRALLNAPNVVIQNDEKGNASVSVVSQEKCKDSNCRAIAKVDANKDIFDRMPLEVQRVNGLTILVQDFNLKLRMSALDYIHAAVNGRRFNMNYMNYMSYFRFMDEMRSKIMTFFKSGSRSIHEELKGLPVDDLLDRLASSYNYVIPHIFDSIDSVLVSKPYKEKNEGFLKEELVKGYVEQVMKYKRRLFKRSILRPKMRYSPTKDALTPLTGEEMGELLRHLVGALNNSIQSGDTDYLGEINVTRAKMAKRDLLDLYANDLQGLVKRIPIPLESDMDKFNRELEDKYKNHFIVYAKHDLSLDVFQTLNVDLENSFRKTFDHFKKLLHDTTLEHCRSKIPAMKKKIDEKISQFKLPVIPTLIKKLEDDKEEIMKVFEDAVDEKGIKYSGTMACKVVYKEALAVVNDAIATLYKNNESDINMLFHEAARISIDYFISRADRNLVDNYKVPREKFEETLNLWSKSSHELFYENIGDFKTLDKHTKGSLSFLEKQIKLLEREAVDHWHDVCRDTVIEMSRKFSGNFETQLKKLIPFRPAPKPVINLAIDYLRACASKDLEGLYCKTSHAVEEGKSVFNRVVEESRKRVLAENYDFIFSRFVNEFKAMHDEAFEKVDQMYSFYQVKNHLKWFAKWYIFNNLSLLDQELCPKRNIEVLKKNVNIDLLKGLPDENNLLGRLTAVKEHDGSGGPVLPGLDLRELANDIVEEWLDTKLYPSIRHRLTFRMPKVATVCAAVWVFASSMVMCNVNDLRVLHFLYLLNGASFLYILGPRNAFAVLAFAVSLVWRLFAFASNILGPLVTSLIVTSIVAFTSLWYIFSTKIATALRKYTHKAKDADKA